MEMSRPDIIKELEGLGDTITNPDEHTTEKLAEDLRYHLCANCVEYESRKLCHTCDREIVIIPEVDKVCSGER